MTTKTDITLPPLPVALNSPLIAGHANAYARAAVEADRQGRMPSDEELLKVCESAGFLFHYDRYVPGSGYGLQAKAYTLENFHALLSHYSSGQPAASAEPVAQELTRSSISVSCPHCGAGPYYYCAHPFRTGGGAAPVAQEPVAWMTADGRVAPDETKRKSMPAPSREAFCIPLYAAPVAAQARPTMPALTDAMRAVLRNEHCVYDSEDTLYAALCNAAGPAPSAQDREDAAALRAILMESPEAVSYPNESWTDAYAEWRTVAIDAARAAKGADHA